MTGLVNLEVLSLNSNLLTTIKFLRKIDYPGMKYIDIAENPIHDLELVSEVKGK